MALTGAVVVDSIGFVGGALSVPLPVGAQEGDLLVVAAAHWTEPVTISDSRMTVHHTFPGQAVPMGAVWVGVEDGSGANITATVLASSRPSVVVVAIRRAEFAGTELVESAAPSAVTPLAVPQVSPSRAALVVALSRTGEFSTGGIERTGSGYTQLESVTNAGHTNAYLGIWHSGTGLTTSPADSFTFGGSIDGNGVLVLDLSPKPAFAPPARLFPREDGLGVGGGRIYPPPKSQQKSGRRFGYY